MQIKPKLFSFDNTILFISLIIVATFQLYATKCQIGLTYDSNNYLAASKSWITEGTFKNAFGEAYTNWPPLFPFIISMGGKAMLEWGRFFQCISLLGIVISSSIISRKYIFNSHLRVWFLCTITFSTPLLLVSSFLWSEAFFILLLLILFLLIEDYCQKENFKLFLSLLLVSNLLALQRTAGLIFIIVFALIILRNKGVLEAFIYGIFSSLGALLWMIRNSFLEDQPTILSNVSVIPFKDSLLGYLESMSFWFVPLTLPLLGFVFLIGIFLFVLLYSLRNKLKKFQLVAILMILTYFAFLLLLRMTPGENDRYVVPIYPLLLLVLVSIVDEIVTNLTSNKKMIVLFILFLWLVYPISRTVKNCTFWHNINCGVNSF